MSISSSNIKPDPGFFKTVFFLPSHLCLDAPLVAISWSTAIEFLRLGSIESPFPHIALFFAVWTIYLFDRLYDSRPGLSQQRESLRHQFAARNRGILFFLFFTAIATCTFMHLSGVIHRAFLQWGILISVPVILYFVFFRFFKTALKSSCIPMKEITIGMCFASGTCLASGAIFPAQFFPLGILFTLNCLIISRSEADEDSCSDPAAFYSSAEENGSPRLELLFTLLACGAVWIFSNKIPFQLAVTCSSIALIALATCRQSTKDTQALADVALLTLWPILWIIS